MRQFHAVLSRSDEGGWRVTVPDIGEVELEEPGLADFHARRLLRDQVGVDWQASQDATLTLVDDDGEPVYVFDLLFTGDRATEASERETRYAALAAQPPAGCQYLTLGEYPALRCVRHGPDRLAAVAQLVAEVRVRYGLDGDDLGYEKLWEWAGSREWREGMVAQLLLMAVQRARWLGVPAEQLTAFVSTAAGSPESGEQPASS